MKEYEVDITFKNTVNDDIQDAKRNKMCKTKEEAKAFQVVMKNILNLPEAIQNAVKNILGISSNSFHWSMYDQIDAEIYELITTRKKMS